MTIGKRIRTLRIEYKITQEQLAKHLNISYQAVSKWENEDSQPDIALLVPIAKFFNTTVDDLLDNFCLDESKAYESRREKLIADYELNQTDHCFKLADDAYKDYIVHHSASTKDLWNYAYLYDLRAMYDTKKALAMYEKAIYSKGNKRDLNTAYEEMVRLLLRNNQKDKALSYLESWLKEDESNVYSYIQLANFYHVNEAYEKAYEYIKLAKLQEEQVSELYLIEGEILESLERYDQAIKAWDHSFDLYSGIARAIYNKAELYEVLKEKDKAIKTWQEILLWHERQGFNSKQDLKYPKNRLRALLDD